MVLNNFKSVTPCRAALRHRLAPGRKVSCLGGGGGGGDDNEEDEHEDEHIE